MKTLSACTLSIFLAYSTLSYAENWVSDPEGDFYMDIAYARIKGDTITTWIKYPVKSGGYHLSLDNYDCKNIRAKGYEIIAYNANGESEAHVVNKNAKWESVIPGTTGKHIFIMACALWNYKTGQSPKYLQQN